LLARNFRTEKIEPKIIGICTTDKQDIRLYVRIGTRGNVLRTELKPKEKEKKYIVSALYVDNEIPIISMFKQELNWVGQVQIFIFRSIQTIVNWCIVQMPFFDWSIVLMSNINPSSILKTIGQFSYLGIQKVVSLVDRSFFYQSFIVQLIIHSQIILHSS